MSSSESLFCSLNGWKRATGNNNSLNQSIIEPTQFETLFVFSLAVGLKSNNAKQAVKFNENQSDEEVC